MLLFLLIFRYFVPAFYLLFSIFALIFPFFPTFPPLYPNAHNTYRLFRFPDVSKLQATRLLRSLASKQLTTGDIDRWVLFSSFDHHLDDATIAANIDWKVISPPSIATTMTSTAAMTANVTSSVTSTTTVDDVSVTIDAVVPTSSPSKNSNSTSSAIGQNVSIRALFAMQAEKEKAKEEIVPIEGVQMID